MVLDRNTRSMLDRSVVSLKVGDGVPIGYVAAIKCRQEGDVIEKDYLVVFDEKDVWHDINWINPVSGIPYNEDWKVAISDRYIDQMTPERFEQFRRHCHWIDSEKVSLIDQEAESWF